MTDNTLLPTPAAGTAAGAAAETAAEIAAGGPAGHRERNPRGEGDRLRVELLDAAVELMAEKGDLDAISLRAIAARAGVSPTAVYRHFDDHHALLVAAVAHCWEEFDRALDDGVADAPTGAAGHDPYARFRRSGDAYVAFALGQPGKYHVLFSNKIDLGDAHETVGEATFGKLVDRVAAILDARDDDRDPRFVACEVHTWIHGIVDLIGRHRDFEWPPIDLLLDDLQVRLGLTRPAC